MKGGLEVMKRKRSKEPRCLEGLNDGEKGRYA